MYHLQSRCHELKYFIKTACTLQNWGWKLERINKTAQLLLQLQIRHRKMDDTLTEIQAFLRIDETAAEFLARTYAAPIFTSVPFIDGRMPLRQGNVIEVSGMTGSGKTELLIQVGLDLNVWSKSKQKTDLTSPCCVFYCSWQSHLSSLKNYTTYPLVGSKQTSSFTTWTASLISSACSNFWGDASPQPLPTLGTLNCSLHLSTAYIHVSPCVFSTCFFQQTLSTTTSKKTIIQEPSTANRHHRVSYRHQFKPFPPHPMPQQLWIPHLSQNPPTPHHTAHSPWWSWCWCHPYWQYSCILLHRQSL